jgi:hypothetical protein
VTFGCVFSSEKRDLEQVSSEIHIESNLTGLGLVIGTDPSETQVQSHLSLGTKPNPILTRISHDQSSPIGHVKS